MNGFKRVSFLSLFLAAVWLKALGVEDPYILKLLEAKPDVLPVAPGLVVASIGALYSIYDGIKKAVAERRAKRDALADIRRFL